LTLLVVGKHYYYYYDYDYYHYGYYGYYDDYYQKLVPWGTDGRLPLSGDFRSLIVE